jgi:hypothetical protein
MRDGLRRRAALAEIAPPFKSDDLRSIELIGKGRQALSEFLISQIRSGRTKRTVATHPELDGEAAPPQACIKKSTRLSPHSIDQCLTLSSEGAILWVLHRSRRAIVDGYGGPAVRFLSPGWVFFCAASGSV